MLRVYQCKECGKTIITKNELKKLDGWVELKAGSTDAAQEKHVPVVTKKCKSVKVDVGSVAHPMTAEHLIEWVALSPSASVNEHTGSLPAVKYFTW